MSDLNGTADPRALGKRLGRHGVSAMSTNSQPTAPSSDVKAMVDAVIAAGYTCQSVLARLDDRLAATPPGPGRDNLLDFRKQLVAKINDNG